VGKLGADPFIDAQDWEINSVEVALSDTAADKARATVSFKNLGQPQTVSSTWSNSSRIGASPTSPGTARRRCAAC
jgi:hypothetical protein